MGATEELCLRWNDFESSFKNGFSRFRDRSEFYDVTLASNGVYIKAHKVILCACSPFFHEIIRNIPHDHPFIYLRDIKPKHLESILSFMYSGEVNVLKEDLEHFLSVAEELQINGLFKGVSHKNQEQKRPRISELPSSSSSPPQQSICSENNVQGSKNENQKTGPPITQTNKVMNLVEEVGGPKKRKKARRSIDRDSDRPSNPSSLVHISYLDKSELDVAIDKLICRSPSGHIYCAQCNYSTALQRSIRDHIEAKHIVTDGFECGTCSLRCKTRASLRRHHYRRHPKESDVKETPP
ncbi:Protein tramtrack_ alpha isoformlike [Caligus rogercresseyi]|uniref:Protein tramtrack_ alpha isoformlike n=1 Tax=Caligus rogercresseyi TaxID=217165 RepID=A0A7T8HLF8_CALRO|nr:Protein tramtrack_ alpha isoformlike [Caligus rogercresseyi]